MKKKEVHVELFGGETQLFEEKVLKYTKIPTDTNGIIPADDH